MSRGFEGLHVVCLWGLFPIVEGPVAAHRAALPEWGTQRALGPHGRSHTQAGSPAPTRTEFQDSPRQASFIVEGYHESLRQVL